MYRLNFNQQHRHLHECTTMGSGNGEDEQNMDRKNLKVKTAHVQMTAEQTLFMPLGRSIQGLSVAGGTVFNAT